MTLLEILIWEDYNYRNLEYLRLRNGSSTGFLSVLGALPGLSRGYQEEGRGCMRGLGVLKLLEKFSLGIVKEKAWGVKR